MAVDVLIPPSVLDKVQAVALRFDGLPRSYTTRMTFQALANRCLIDAHERQAFRLRDGTVLVEPPRLSVNAFFSITLWIDASGREARFAVDSRWG